MSMSGCNVAVIGASGGIGQPLSLLLKLDDNIKELTLFDVVRTPGVAADLSHCNTPVKVKSFVGMDNIGNALKGQDVVIIPAGMPRSPGMTRDDLFNTNAKIVKTIAEACAWYSPNAIFLIISNPVNSMVPLFAETLKLKGMSSLICLMPLLIHTLSTGTYDPRKVFGVTTLDIVRANTFVAEHQGLDVKKMKVSVIGGHAGTTILPLLSQVPNTHFTDQEIAQLTHRIQFGGDEVVQAKDGAGSATLSMAFAGYSFATRLFQAIQGVPNVVENTFVENNLTAAPFFATPVSYIERHVI